MCTQMLLMTPTSELIYLLHKNSPPLPVIFISHKTADDPPPLASQGSRGDTEEIQFATRLPKLEIPVFTGEPLDWQPF